MPIITAWDNAKFVNAEITKLFVYWKMRCSIGSGKPTIGKHEDWRETETEIDTWFKARE